MRGTTSAIPDIWKVFEIEILQGRTMESGDLRFV